MWAQIDFKIDGEADDVPNKSNNVVRKSKKKIREYLNIQQCANRVSIEGIFARLVSLAMARY